MKHLNGIELTMLLQERFGRITLQLGKIEIKINFFNPFIHLLTYNSFVPICCVIFGTRLKRKQKNM
jgi:hypothetical protein